jgi:hypothetical protein
MMQYTSAERSVTGMIPGITLLGVWLAGLSLGLLADRFYGDCYELLVFSAGCAALTFLDACLVTILPLLLSAFAVFIFHRFGACLACFLRGLTMGFFLGVLTAAGGAWLAVLLLFSGLCFCPVLLWYLWRRFFEGLRNARRDFALCCLAGLCLAAVDTWVVAPFLATALTF